MDALPPTNAADERSLLTVEEKGFAADERLLLKALRAVETGLDSSEIQAVVKRRWSWPRVEAALEGLYRKRRIYPSLVRKSNRWTVVWRVGSIEDAIKKDGIVAVLGASDAS